MSIRELPMSKTQMLLVRHCESEGNIFRRTHGLFDSNITPKGKHQLKYLSRRFADIPFDAIYSSTLRRAQLTAQAIADVKKFKVIEDYRLNERAMGIFENGSWHEIQNQFPSEFSNWRTDQYNYTIPLGESESSAVTRFKSSLFEIACANVGKTVVIVTHSMMLRALAENVSEESTNNCYENTSVSCFWIDTKSKAFEIEYLNDYTHLPQELASTMRESWWRSAANLDDYSLRFIHFSKKWLPTGDSELAAIFYGSKNARTVVGYKNDENVGAMSYAIKDSIVLIDSVYIKQKMRQRGFASQLLGELIYQNRKANTRQIQIKYQGSSPDLFGWLQKNAFEYISERGIYVKDIDHVAF